MIYFFIIHCIYKLNYKYIFKRSVFMSSEKVLKRDEIQEQYKWKLEHLFQTDELWEKTYNEIVSAKHEQAK